MTEFQLISISYTHSDSYAPDHDGHAHTDGANAHNNAHHDAHHHTTDPYHSDRAASRGP